MHPVEIRNLVKNALREPIRIYVSDGATYEVRHPDMAWVSHTAVLIGILPGEDGIPFRSVHVDPEHITRIEPLSESGAAAAAKHNGKE